MIFYFGAAKAIQWVNQYARSLRMATAAKSRYIEWIKFDMP